MTREEAISKAINIVRYFEANFAKSKEARKDAVDIIEALEQEPCEDWYDIPSEEMTLEQARSAVRELREKLCKCMFTPTCEDAVSRQAVLDAMETWDWQDLYLPIHFKQLLEDLPSVTCLEKQNRSGEWILTDDDFVYCSECEDSYYPRPIDASWYFCPHCGARMGGAE